MARAGPGFNATFHIVNSDPNVIEFMAFEDQPRSRCSAWALLASGLRGDGAWFGR
jgi:hypothetical protein